MAPSSRQHSQVASSALLASELPPPPPPLAHRNRHLRDQSLCSDTHNDSVAAGAYLNCETFRALFPPARTLLSVVHLLDGRSYKSYARPAQLFDRTQTRNRSRRGRLVCFGSSARDNAKCKLLSSESKSDPADKSLVCSLARLPLLSLVSCVLLMLAFALRPPKRKLELSRLELRTRFCRR